MFWREHGNDPNAWQSQEGRRARKSALAARNRGMQVEMSSSALEGNPHETWDDTATAAATPAAHRVAAFASTVPTLAFPAPAVDPAVVEQFTTSLSALGKSMDSLYVKLDQVEKRFVSAAAQGTEQTLPETDTAIPFVSSLADLAAHPGAAEQGQSSFHIFVNYGLAGELPQIVMETLTPEELHGYLVGRRCHQKTIEDCEPKRELEGQDGTGIQSSLCAYACC